MARLTYNKTKRDQLYVLGGGSKHNDFELRMSLRSIEKYCEGYDRVFIVGRKPTWVGNVEFYPCEDDMGMAHKNILKKIMYACHETDISEWFTLQADDHFYTKPYDFRRVRPYEKGELPPPPREKQDAYYLSMLDTTRYLKEHGLPYMNGSQHCGCIFNKRLLLEHEEDLIKPCFDTEYGIEPSSLMGAMLNKYMGIPYEHRTDCKVYNFDGEYGLKRIVGDNFCFSIADRAFQCLIQPILLRWYSTPSKYESNNQPLIF